MRGIIVRLFASSLYAATLVLLLASVAGYAGRSHKLAELASHFRVQYLLGALACLSLLLALRSWSWVALALVCCLVNLAAIVPWYLPPARDAAGASSGRRLKLMLANVNFANSQHDRLIELVNIEQPDVLVLQEVSKLWIDALRSLEARYTHRIAAPVDGDGSGIALFSRLPLEDARIIDLGSEAEGVRPSITARVNVDGLQVSLLTIHPRAPIRAGHFELRNAQLADAARFVRELPEPRLFVGDLNTTLFSPYYADFIETSNLTDARRGAGLLPTFPTRSPLGALTRLPIDHCFVGRGVRVRGIKVGDDFGSDHLPLIAELEVALP